MKSGRLYMIFMGIAMLIVFLIEYNAPHQFRWTPTFDGRDHEPYGSYVFDDIVASSVDNYTVINKTLYQLTTEDTLSPRAFLLTEKNILFSETDITALRQLLCNGNRIMLCSTMFSHIVLDSFCFSVDHNYSWPNYNALQNQQERDTIFFGTDTLNPDCIYTVYPQMCQDYILLGKYSWEENTDTIQSSKFNIMDSLFNVIKDSTLAILDTILDADSLPIRYAEQKTIKAVITPLQCDSMEILARNSKKQPVAARLFIDKGELYVVATPLMFTNFGMLDGNNASYVFRLLSYMKDTPLVRVEAYGDHNKASRSPLRYFLATPPLRWAIYSAMTLLLLFMIAAARRRQRAIPVVHTAPNRMLNYVSLISDLYFQRHDNGEILKIKHACFCAEVKNAIGIDLWENIPDEADYKRISERTGITVERLTTLLQNAQIAVYRSDVSDKYLKLYIDGMNELLNALK